MKADTFIAGARVDGVPDDDAVALDLASPMLRVRALDDGAAQPVSARPRWLAFTLAMIAIGALAWCLARQVAQIAQVTHTQVVASPLRPLLPEGSGRAAPATAPAILKAPAIAPIAIGVCALAMAAVWMWWARDAVSIEAAVWEARGRLIRDASPPGMTLTFPSLVLDAVFVTGSARGAAIALGAVSLAGLFLLIGLRRIVLVDAAAPAAPRDAARGRRVSRDRDHHAADRRHDGRFHRAPALARHHSAADRRACDGPSRADDFAWPLWLLVSIVLLLMPRGTWTERLARWLIALFPALFMSAAWAANWSETGWLLYFLHVPQLSLQHMEQWASHLRGPAFSAHAAAMMALAATPVIWLLPAALSQRDSAMRERLTRGDARLQTGTWLLALAPLLMLGLRASQGDIASSLSALGYVLATAIAIVRLAREQVIRTGAAYTLLLIGSMSAWAVVISQDDDPGRVLASVRTGKPMTALTPFVHVADAVRERLRPGDRVSFDDVELFPLAAMLDPSTRIPSSSIEFALAQQHARHQARLVVVPETGSPWSRRSIVELSSDTLHAHYRLIDRAGSLLVYERWARSQ